MANQSVYLNFIKKIDLFSEQRIKSFSWLYAPPKDAIFFTFRTIIASFLALVIALWMELDSPKWALMTVWIVSQTSPGETISKSQWRVVGTLIGVAVAIMIVAIFPQQPILFMATIAIWMAACCWFGSLIRSSSAYSAVLAGYTCALIALSSVSDPDSVFMTGMARGTYIILGVLCQTFVERIFAVNMTNNARVSLHDNLLKAITGSLNVVIDTLKGNYKAAFRVQNVFTAVSAFQGTIEFRKVELLNDDHTSDHVHAALFSLSVVLTRLINLNVYMNHFKKDQRFKDLCFRVTTYLEELVNSLSKSRDSTEHLKSLKNLRWECRQVIADSIYKDTSLNNIIEHSEVEDNCLNDRILYRSLSELLGEVEIVLHEYEYSQKPQKKDGFRYKLPHLYNFKQAWGNGFRIFVAITFVAFLWEITAWNELPSAIGLLCVACGRLCLFENGYKMSLGFFKGILYGIICAAILNVTLVPLASSIEMVWLMLFIPMFIGGLAIYHLPTRGSGMSFTIFFPFMIIASNQTRMDEITFLNSALVIFCGVGMAVFAFRFLAPYSPKKVRREIRRRMLLNISKLATVTSIPMPRRWLASTMDWFVSLMRQFDPETEAMLFQKYNHGALAVMSIGLNLIELRHMINHDLLSEDVKNELRVVMRRISSFKARKHSRTMLVTESAIRRLKKRERFERNLSMRLELSAAIGCLMLIEYALRKNVSFLRL